ncbi:MAG TPA: S49 family peptidase [Anaerolineales bacterium]|nr:S49 family peptidase [Anaerolineales bacterium]
MSEADTPVALPAPVKKKPSMWRALGQAAFWIVLPLMLGLWLSSAQVKKPAVGIVRINTEIWSLSAELVNDEIEAARRDPRIKAVVVQIETPGGEVVATQSIYYELLNLRQQMPVVGYIDSYAASGGYYVAMAVDPLFAKPSSTVGNVGVWGYFPSNIGVNDVVLASGPFKLTASNTEEFLREIDGIKQEFLATVAAGRGDRLVMSRSDLSQGLAYPGRQALSLGLVDEMGGQSDAIDRAAELAGLDSYVVVDLERQVLATEKYQELYYGGLPAWEGATNPKTGERSLPPGLYLLYDARLGSTRR